MFILVVLYADGTFQGIHKFSTYYDFLRNLPANYYSYKLYEDLGNGELKCVKERV